MHGLDSSSGLGSNARGVRTKVVDAGSLPEIQRRQKFLDLYLFVVDSCLRAGATQWWRRAVSLPFADQALAPEALKELCLHGLLYEAGDLPAVCRTYEVLEEEGYLATDGDGQYLLDLLRFIRPLLKEDAPRPGLAQYFFRHKKPAAVVSLIIPDDRSFSAFTDLCLPSLKSEGALSLLFGRRDVTLVLSGREHHIAALQERLQEGEGGWNIICQPIPDRLCDGLIPGEVRQDWLLGALQYLHMTEARNLGADFLAINPKAIYATGYLKEVLRLAKSKPAILSATVWINNRGLIDQGLVRNQDGSATVSPIDLVTMGLDVVAPANCTMFVEGFGSIRGSTAHLRVVWSCDERIEIHSTMHEVVFLSRKTVQDMPRRFFMRPAAQMDRIVATQTALHFVSERDGIGIGEFGHPPGALADVAGDAHRFETVTTRLLRRGQVEILQRPVRLAITRSAEASPAGQDAADDSSLRHALQKALDQAPAGAKASQALTALNVMHQYEMSEYGLENMAGAIAEGRRLVDLGATDSGMNLVERNALIRSAMNFDHVDKAIELARLGGEDTSFIHEFLGKMMELRAANVALAKRLRPRFGRRRSFAVLGSIVWGDSFIEKFMNYHVASLLAPGNIPALARRRRVVHSIVTTDADRTKIIAHPVFKRLSQSAEIVFTCFPEKFLEQRERAQYNFYHFYGLLDHQSVFLAAALRAELYLLPVDIVLSQDGLKNFGRHLDHGVDGCAVACMECEPEPLRDWLDGKPRGPAHELVLPAGELLDAAISLPDAYARSLVMNDENRTFCRHARELIWPHSDGLSVHSVFMHPLALSARLMSRPFHPQHENVDYALLPRLLQGDAKLEVLQDAREFAGVQFGAPAGREDFLDGGFSLEVFVEAHHYNYVVQRSFFGTRQFFPCKDSPYAPSTSEDLEVELIKAALKRYRFRR